MVMKHRGSVQLLSFSLECAVKNLGALIGSKSYLDSNRSETAKVCTPPVLYGFLANNVCAPTGQLLLIKMRP